MATPLISNADIVKCHIPSLYFKYQKFGESFGGEYPHSNFGKQLLYLVMVGSAYRNLKTE